MRSGGHVARGVASPRCKREGSQPTCSTKGPQEDGGSTRGVPAMRCGYDGHVCTCREYATARRPSMAQRAAPVQRGAARREACRRDAVQPRGAHASERRGAARGSKRSAWRPQEALVQEEMPTGVALHRCQARGCARPRARRRRAPGHNAGNQRAHAWEARSRCVARWRTATSVRIETKRHDDHGHRQTLQG
jgi:hypothetical protein